VVGVIRRIRWWLAVSLSKVIGLAILEPQLRLGRRRHDNVCDQCGEDLDRYAMEKLDFPIDDMSPEANTAREKLRAMLNAEYTRDCLECSVELEDSAGNGGEPA
jgi:hypothetical protein